MREDINSSSSEKEGMGKSVVLKSLNWRFIKLTLIFIMGYFALGEFFFRLDVVQDKLTGPRIGSRHRQFEIQVARLEKLIQNGESVDCIFLGNSMIWLGVDPLVVNQTFQNKTGQEIHCFNFGVSALPASSAGEIASMLVQRYRPKLLIYGTFARDYAIPSDAEDAYVVTETPWLGYQNGTFTTKGWFYSYSSIFQYNGHLRDFLLNNFLEDVFNSNDFPQYQNYGLDPKYDTRTDVRILPDFDSKDNRDPVNWLGHFKIQPENLNGLEKIIQLSNKGVQVIVIEMPFYETAYAFFPNGEQDYEDYIHQIDSIAASFSTPFWRLDEQPAFPSNLWWDYFHLNIDGVNVFSRWLGDRLADTYLQGELKVAP